MRQMCRGTGRAVCGQSPRTPTGLFVGSIGSAEMTQTRHRP